MSIHVSIVVSILALMLSAVSCGKKKKKSASDASSSAGEVFSPVQSSIRSSSVPADTIPPTLSFTSMTPAQTDSLLFPTVLGTTSEPAKVTIYYDSSCSAPKSREAEHTVFVTSGISVTGAVNPNATTVFYGKAVDPSGNISSCILLTTYTHSSNIPMVTSVSSTSNDGSYITGQTLSVSITFTETVIVTGTPQLVLETGASDAVASYNSGSGSKTLTFYFNVASSDNTYDLDYASRTSLSLNGGTIKDLDGNNGDRQLPPVGGYSSLAGQKAIVIDMIAPTITYTSISPASPGVSRSPTMTLSISEDATVTLYSNVTCSAILSAPAPLKLGSGQTVMTTTLSMNTATTIYAKAVDPSGNASTCTNLVVYSHDDIAPVVTSFTRAAGQASMTNSVPINFTVTFSEAINPASFTAGDISNAGSATGVAWSITNSGDNLIFTVAATASGNGTIQPRIALGSIADVATNVNGTAITSTNNVAYSSAAFTVRINQASTQSDPVKTLPIQFTVIFSDAVGSGTFTPSDIVNNGTATGITWSLATTDNITWTLTGTVSGAGTIIPSISSSSVSDAYGNSNAASTSTDNTVTLDLTVPSITYSSVSPSTVASTLRPTILGTVSEASVVTLYLDSGCSTVASASVANTVFASPGIALSSDVNSNAATTIYAQAVDAAGNVSNCTSLVTYAHDGIGPVITNVSSSLANGSYKLGQVIPINVTFSETVNVIGTPRITLETGVSDAVVNYASGSGTTTLTFNYTVGAGHTSADLEYQSTSALALNGGTIKDAVGNNATLSLPALSSAGSLSGSKTIMVDTTAPTIVFSSITPTSPGLSPTPFVSLVPSEAAMVTLYSDSACSSSISSQQEIVIGGSSITTYALTANNATAIFAKALDVAGNASSCTFMTAYVYDSIAPTVVSVSSGAANGTYGVGSGLPITLTFGEAVTVSGNPQITLETGSVDAVVNYTSGSGSTVLTFYYTVAAGNASSDLDYISTYALALNGGTIKDFAGNNATLPLPTVGNASSVAGQKAIVIDTAQFGVGCSAPGLRTPTRFSAQVEYATAVMQVNVASTGNLCTRLKNDASCTYRCAVRFYDYVYSENALLVEGRNTTNAAYVVGDWVHFEIGFDLKSNGTSSTPLAMRITGITAGTMKVSSTLSASSVGGYDKAALATSTGTTSNPLLSTAFVVTSSPGSSLTPTVQMDVNVNSLASGATVRLYSDNNCVTAISPATAFTNGTGKQMQTGTLASGSSTSIYGQAVSGSLMTGCVYFGTYVTQ